MTWTAPDVDRDRTPTTGSERELLEAWLDWHRLTFLRKCSGLTGEQLARNGVPPSELSLQGLARHLADVERGWFRGGWDPTVTGPLLDFSQDPDADMHDVDPARAEEDFAMLEEQVALARAEAARHELDEETTAPWRGFAVSLRWIYLHMIEEYARHNGHSDLLREVTDGSTGL